ncbi:MAG: hypothetical protein JSR80_01575 [Verrucomicrobia bacterium]|nr:hypothetical protein [Verrucomicrobiota bacterium]
MLKNSPVSWDSSSESDDFSLTFLEEAPNFSTQPGARHRRVALTDKKLRQLDSHFH